jgi:hypothetical protein
LDVVVKRENSKGDRCQGYFAGWGGGRGEVFFDAAEREAVDGRGSEGGDGGAVGGGWVSFMGSESIVWIEVVGGGHEEIAGDFGEDRGGGDVPAEVVARDDGVGGPGSGEGVVAVDEDGGGDLRGRMGGRRG